MYTVLVEAAFSRGSVLGCQQDSVLLSFLRTDMMLTASHPLFTKVLSGEHDLGSQKGPAFWM